MASNALLRRGWHEIAGCSYKRNQSWGFRPTTKIILLVLSMLFVFGGKSSCSPSTSYTCQPLIFATENPFVMPPKNGAGFLWSTKMVRPESGAFPAYCPCSILNPKPEKIDSILFLRREESLSPSAPDIMIVPLGYPDRLPAIIEAWSSVIFRCPTNNARSLCFLLISYFSKTSSPAKTIATTTSRNTPSITSFSPRLVNRLALQKLLKSGNSLSSSPNLYSSHSPQRTIIPPIAANPTNTNSADNNDEGFSERRFKLIWFCGMAIPLAIFLLFSAFVFYDVWRKK